MGIVKNPNLKGKGKCKCFLFPMKAGKQQDTLCFRKGVVGALNDEQEDELCSKLSFVPQPRGYAVPPESVKVQNILEAMRDFTEGVKMAQPVYEMTGETDIPIWRESVREVMEGLKRGEREEILREPARYAKRIGGIPKALKTRIRTEEELDSERVEEERRKRRRREPRPLPEDRAPIFLPEQNSERPRRYRRELD